MTRSPRCESRMLRAGPTVTGSPLWVSYSLWGDMPASSSSSSIEASLKVEPGSMLRPRA